MKPFTTRALLTLGLMVILALVATLSGERVLAQKKGGGGAGSNGGGTIYFRTGGNQLYTMNDDGSGKTALTGFNPNLPFYPLATFSRTKHAGLHWALQNGSVYDEGAYPDFYPEGHPNAGELKEPDWRREVFALSNGGHVVRLTNDPELEPLPWPQWGLDDATISFVARRWDADILSPTFGTVVEGGLYQATIDYNEDGMIAGLTEAPRLIVPVPLLAALPASVDIRESPGPDAWNHDWSPTGNAVVFDTHTGTQLVIADLVNEEFNFIAADPTARDISQPRWSPARDWIAFRYHPDGARAEIRFIKPDGSQWVTLDRTTATSEVSPGRWSPMGTHYVYTKVSYAGKNASYLIRVRADGTGATQITDNIAVSNAPQVNDWR